MASLLVVEDEPKAAVALQAYVEQQGWVCWTAATTEEALRLLAAHQPDALLVDLHLEHCRHADDPADGFEVLRVAKARFPQIKTIVMTACGDETHQAMADALGADGFLTKPFCLDEVGRFFNPVP